VIVLAFDRVLGPEARERIQFQLEQATNDGKIIVVEECHVLSDGATEHATIEFDDGKVMFIPKGIRKQHALEAIQKLIDEEKKNEHRRRLPFLPRQLGQPGRRCQLG
jgi:hypothetical protein